MQRTRQLIRLLAALAATAACALAAAPSAVAAFPGENGKIAFSSGSFGIRGGRLDITTVEAAGGALRRLTTTPSSDNLSQGAAWSPDGRRIAFHRFFYADDSCRIYVMDADGSDLREIPTNAHCAASPAWSPDGHRIAFQREQSSPTYYRDIWVMDADGRHPTRLTTDPGDDLNPAWSPDGSKIAFEGQRDDDRKIVATSADGSGDEIDLSGRSDVWDGHPAWSPDGRRIAFDRVVVGEGPDGVWVMDADGDHEARISAFGSAPDWSPDGEQLVVEGPASDPSDRGDIWIVGANGSDSRRLAREGTDDLSPAWQPLTGGEGPSPSEPPDCSRIQPDRRVLWPPDRAFHLVYLRDGRDPDGDVVEIEVRGVTQDEPLTGRGDRTSPDALFSGIENRIYLRAERRKGSRADGRVYRILYTARTEGGSCRGVAKVGVPRWKDSRAVNSHRYFQATPAVGFGKP
jgi:Tol biopolymer transport system component